MWALASTPVRRPATICGQLVVVFTVIGIFTVEFWNVAAASYPQGKPGIAIAYRSAIGT
jgi:hypothetical protein